MLLAHSPADVRFFHATAPDFSSTLDAIVEIEEVEPPSDWTRCASEIRELMANRHATLDFTGLLPNVPEMHQLPLRELYQALVHVVARPSEGAPGCLILGDPGTGKSTYLRHLAWTYATGSGDPLDLGTKLPVLMSLSDYGEDRAQYRVRPLLEYLPTWLEQQGIEGAWDVGQHLAGVMLLLDGLDELREPGARRAVLDEVIELVEAQAVGAVIITGRTFLVDELAELSAARRHARWRAARSERGRVLELIKALELRYEDASCSVGDSVSSKRVNEIIPRCKY